jgi:Recombinase zinc beta ribbon domain
MQVRPREERIAVPTPPIVCPQQFADAQERLQQTQQWSRRNTKGEYLLRHLMSCRRCGLAHGVRTNKRYGSYHCKGSDTLVQRRRPEPCHAPQARADHLDQLVWQDLRDLCVTSCSIPASCRRPYRVPSSSGRTAMPVWRVVAPSTANKRPFSSRSSV